MYNYYRYGGFLNNEEKCVCAYSQPLYSSDNGIAQEGKFIHPFHCYVNARRSGTIAAVYITRMKWVLSFVREQKALPMPTEYKYL